VSVTKGLDPSTLLPPRLPPRNGWETGHRGKQSPSPQVSEMATQKRALQPENKPLDHLMLLITGKCKTLLIYHQTLLSRPHFHILAMTFSFIEEYSVAQQPLPHQADSPAQDVALHAWAGFNCLQCFPQGPPSTGINLLKNGQPASAPSSWPAADCRPWAVTRGKTEKPRGQPRPWGNDSPGAEQWLCAATN